MTKYAAEGSWDAVKGLLPSGTTIEGTPLGQQLRNLLGAGGRLLQRNAQPIMQAGIGAGLLGLGKATHNQVLGGLGGATLGNLPGRMMGTYFGNQGEVQMPHGLETPDASFWTNNPIEYRNKGGLVGALAGGSLGYAATKATGLDKIRDTVRSLPDRLNPGNWTPENQRALAQGGLGAAALGAGRLTDSRALGAIGGGLLGNAAGGALDRNSDYGGHAGGALGALIGGAAGYTIPRSSPEEQIKESGLNMSLLPEGTTVDGALSMGQQLKNLLGAGGRFVQRNSQPIMQAGVGAGLLGLGDLTRSRLLSGLGGATLGNIPGRMLGGASVTSAHLPQHNETIYASGSDPWAARNAGGALGALIGGAAGYTIPRSSPEEQIKEKLRGVVDRMKAKLGSHYAQGYADALTKLGFASMLAPLAGTLAGPGIRAGLGKVAPRMAGKLSGPIRSGVFDAVAGQAAGSLMAPSAPPAPG